MGRTGRPIDPYDHSADGPDNPDLDPEYQAKLLTDLEILEIVRAAEALRKSDDEPVEPAESALTGEPPLAPMTPDEAEQAWAESVDRGMPITGPTNLTRYTAAGPDGPIVKHGTHDQKTHGRRRTGNTGEGSGDGADRDAGPPGSSARVVGSAEFQSDFNRVMSDSPYRHHVSHYTRDEIDQMVALKSTSGGAGVLVKDHGDGRIEATALYADPAKSAPGEGLNLLKTAVRDHDVNYAECFGEVLRTKYESIGFTVTDTFDFDPAQAPDGWDYDRFNHPSYHLLSTEVRKMVIKKLTGQDAGSDDADPGRDEFYDLTDRGYLAAVEAGIDPDHAANEARAAIAIMGGNPDDWAPPAVG